MCGIKGSHGNCLNIVGMTKIRKIFFFFVWKRLEQMMRLPNALID